MDFLQNPFYLLNATTRDNRQKILELSEERSLYIDPNVCMQARADLINPRKRLAAEMAWLPGLGPKRTKELVDSLERPVAENNIPKLVPIAKANVLASSLLRLSNQTSDNISEQILQLAQAFDDIDSENVRLILNEDRIVSGFSEVIDLTIIEQEIQERRHYYKQVIKTALDSLPPKQLVDIVTHIVKTTTNNGEEEGFTVIHDLVDHYELEVQQFIEKETENIETLVEKVKSEADYKKPDQVLSTIIDQLVRVVKNWDVVVQPIHISAKSRGLDHAASRQVATIVRDLAIHLYNKHEKLEFSQRLTNVLQEVFAEVGGIAERVAEDSKILENIGQQRAKYVEETYQRAEEWRREITYEASIGALFQNTFRISPEGIEWKGNKWSLDSITRMRWGGTRHSVNGIPTGTTYSIFLGTRMGIASIELRKQDVYNNIIDRLWKGVGVRMVTEHLEGLRSGKAYNFNSAVVRDQGMDLERKRFFNTNEYIFCPWRDLVLWAEPGYFCIGKQSDNRISVRLSYQDHDNVHVLEAIIRTFWKRGGDRLSSLLNNG